MGLLEPYVDSLRGDMAEMAGGFEVVTGGEGIREGDDDAVIEFKRGTLSAVSHTIRDSRNGEKCQVDK